jgi:N-methylhydantoinase A
MGVSLEEAASGIVRIVNANMAKGISGNSVERGYDLREFALVTMGGAAALHAAAIAKELNMARVIVPPMSGNFSAVGLVVADLQHDYVRTMAKKEDDVDPTELLEIYKDMEDEGIKQLREERVPDEAVEIAWSADLRYEGQSWELNTPIEATDRLDTDGLRKIANDFHTLHQQVYSYSEPLATLEFVNLRVRVMGKNPTVSLQRENLKPDPGDRGGKETRKVYFDGLGWEEIPIYEREALQPGARILGPGIIEEAISTTLIPPQFVGLIDEFRNIIIEHEKDEGQRPKA